METETEKVILRIGLDGELLGQYNSVKHAANNIDRGNSQCIYNSIWTKKPYRKSLWLYGFIKKEIQLELSPQQEPEHREETFCLRCGFVFTTHNKKTNRICPKCNIINDNLWENNTVYRSHISL